MIISIQLLDFQESAIEELNNKLIIGIDEVGYGCWAGPVFVCALEFKSLEFQKKYKFADSKSISEKKRNEFYDLIKEIANWKMGIGSIEEINSHGLAWAYRKAIERAIEPFSGKQLVIDGIKPNWLDCAAMIKGDQKINAISAASIVAKVERDKLMNELSKEFPIYGWAKNKGYGTKIHQDALKEHGLSKYHRKSYDLAKWLK